MIYYRLKAIIKIAEIWYNYTEKPIGKIDVKRYKFVEKKIKFAFSFEKLFTILIDLTKNEDDLLSGMRKNTKYEINRALKKDFIICGTLQEKGNYEVSAINDYIDFFNAFAKSKHRSCISIKDIDKFIVMKNFCIRYAKKDNEIVTMHSYVISDNTARLYQSCSIFRNSNDSDYKNMVGRANRLLHWDDILYFKNQGISIYDLGGWYGGKTNKEQLLINQFKESFGGKKKQEYSFILPASFLGFISVLIHSCIELFKNILKNG